MFALLLFSFSMRLLESLCGGYFYCYFKYTFLIGRHFEIKNENVQISISDFTCDSIS